MNRRSTVFAAACSLAFVISTAATAQPSVAFQINPAHDGSAVFPDGFAPPLEIAWSRQWRNENSGPMNSVGYPLIVGDKVFVTATPFGRPKSTGMLVQALSLQDGSVLWSRTIGNDYYRFAGLAYDNGRLFAATGDGVVYAIDPETGGVIWHQSIRDSKASGFHSSPTAARGRVFVKAGGWASTLFALDQATGTIDWRQRTRGHGDGTPTVAGSSVFVTQGIFVYNFHDETGRLRWFHQGTRGVEAGTTGPFHAGHVYSNDSTAPKVMSSFKGAQLVASVRNVYKTPAFHRGVGYFPTHEGLVAWSTETHDVLWRRYIFPAIPPIVVNGFIIAVDGLGVMYVLEREAGRPIQRLQLPATITGNGEQVSLPKGIAAGEGYILVPADDTLFALRPAPN